MSATGAFSFVQHTLSPFASVSERLMRGEDWIAELERVMNLLPRQDSLALPLNVLGDDEDIEDEDFDEDFDDEDFDDEDFDDEDFDDEDFDDEDFEDDEFDDEDFESNLSPGTTIIMRRTA